MKKDDKKIIEFKEGEHLNLALLIKGIVKGVTNNGSPYLTLTLQDNTGSIEAKMWDVKPETNKILESGKVYDFWFEVINYRNNLQLKIIKYLPLIQSEVNFDDFITKSSISKDDLRKAISDTIASFKNDNIKAIVKEMLLYYEKDFYEYPAASKIHHNFMGGLATHTVSMLKIGESLCELYPILNRDLLLAGIIIHDLGKISELGGNLVNEYTIQGKLLGHISIAQAKLYEVGVNLNLEDSEELMLLRHLVLSHHGELEYGSPVRPLIIEAEMLTYIDNIDARINALEKILETTADNDFTAKIFSLDNRTFYKHNIK